MPLLLAFNGYLTFAGLVISGLGVVVKWVDSELGQSMMDTGLTVAGVGAARKGLKEYQQTR